MNSSRGVGPAAVVGNPLPLRQNTRKSLSLVQPNLSPCDVTSSHHDRDLLLRHTIDARCPCQLFGLSSAILHTNVRMQWKKKCVSFHAPFIHPDTSQLAPFRLFNICNTATKAQFASSQVLRRKCDLSCSIWSRTHLPYTGLNPISRLDGRSESHPKVLERVRVPASYSGNYSPSTETKRRQAMENNPAKS